MKQGLIEYRRTRREIRKINRETRVDQKSHCRIITLIALILCAAIFIVFEVFSILQAKRIRSQELASGLADEITVELSQINTSFISGDQTLFKDTYLRYRNSLSELNSNDYVKNNQAELLKRLNAYGQILAEEEEDAHLIKLRTAITMLRKELDDIDLKNTSVKLMVEIKESFEDFRNSLDQLQDERFQNLITELISYSDEIIPIIDKAAACIGTCVEKNIRARSQELDDIHAKYQEVFIELDARMSAYYSPAELIELLKMLQ